MIIQEQRVSSKIYQMFEAPQGWLDASLPSFQKELVSKQTFEREDIQTEARVTIIIPIHNEARTLESVFGALLMAEIPSNTKIQIILIVNGCTDNKQSYNLAKSLLSDLGSIEKFELNLHKKYSQYAVDNQPLKVRINNCEFILIESTVPSKTQALNLGNHIAFQHGSELTINLDANNWVEPQAVSNLIEGGFSALMNDTAVVIGGQSRVSYRPSRLTKLFRGTSQRVNKSESPKSADLHGWLMAWNTQWLEQQGGLPPVANDDYTLTLLSRKSDKKVAFIDRAKVWGYFPNSIHEISEAYRRTIRDRLQLLHFYRDDTEIRDWIYQDETCFQPFAQKVSCLVERIKERPKKFWLLIALFLLWEYSAFKGSEMFHNDPTSQSWKELKSTK